MSRNQLTFDTILADSFRAHEKRMVRYISVNSVRYQGFARLITPSLSKEQVYTRIAFAILTANAPFEDSCKALKVATDKAGYVTWAELSRIAGMRPAKADWIN